MSLRFRYFIPLLIIYLKGQISWSIVVFLSRTLGRIQNNIRGRFPPFRMKWSNKLLLAISDISILFDFDEKGLHCFIELPEFDDSRNLAVSTHY